MKFLWYTPTQYCELDPVSLGLGVKSCSAARVNMCVAPTRRGKRLFWALSWPKLKSKIISRYCLT